MKNRLFTTKAQRQRVWKYLFSAALCLCASFSANAADFELRDGDRVAFVGGVFAEREQEDGHIEMMLTRSSFGRDVTFRNLGWSGDTVSTFVEPDHEARPKYVPTLLEYVEKFKPTVVFVSYGMMESFGGETGLRDFEKNYNTLLDKLAKASPARFVMVSPFRHEAIDGDSPEIDAHNRSLKLYVAAIEKIARERNCAFVNLFDALRTNPKQPLTSNGVHLNSRGYIEAAAAIEKGLGLKPAKLKREAVEALRAAIKEKNNNWWYHYRPMNSEYVYPNGTRFQDKIGDTQQPLDKEIAAFADLAKEGDARIAELREKIARGEKVARPDLKTASAQPAGRDPKAPDPEIERKTFQVAEGFEVNLFAADPLIQKPIQMAFDERGRLFVATTTLYPQIKPGEKATDRIIVLEDADGDGRADKTSVFSDGLYIPTGVLPGNDGVYTFDDTTFLHLRDTDGDGRADEKEIVLSGFGTEDSHHKGHVLRYSPGGNIYFNQGVFLHSTIETPRGIVHHSGNWLAGIFEYQPATRKFDVYLASSLPPNPWGHYWNRWGFDFHIDSSGQNGSNFILPTANKSSSAIPVPGGKGKLAGGEIISGRHFPEDWQGNLIAAPFKENRVARWEFSDDGSGYALKTLPPLIVSTDSSFRPVEMRMGPDGALYIADWYNPLIGHMQYHFRDPGRDFTHGRIWRVTAKNRPLVPRFNFAKASINELLEQLKSPEDHNRMQARRVLSECNRKEMLAALPKWVKSLDATLPDHEHHQLEALWMYQTLNVVEPNLLKTLLRAKEPNARAAATSVLRYWSQQIGETQSLDLLAQQVSDPHPRVRLQAVIALSHIPQARSMEIAARALDQPMDPYLEQALKNTANALKAVWLVPAQRGQLTFGGKEAHLQFTLNAVGAKKNEITAAKKIEPGLTKEIIAQQLSERQSPEALVRAITQLAALDLPFAAGHAARILEGNLPAQYVAPLFDAFLQRKDGSDILAKAMTKVQPDNARLGLRHLQSIGRPDEALLKKLSDSAGVNMEIAEMSRAELAPWVKEVQSTGDPVAGEKIFHRADLNCFGCHAIGGAGGQLGPELGAVGSGSTIDYLLESILFPNKVIKDGYSSVEVTTKDDEYVLGIRVRENKDELVLRDAARNEIIIPAANIKEKNEKRTSLMPTGLANSLTHAELIDLARFLSELGKPGTYANNPAPVVRRWRVLGPVKPETVLAETASLPWTTTYSRVSGILPLESFPANADFSLAQFEIQMTTPGKVKLKINSIDGLRLWIDSASQELKESPVLNLQAGKHQITFLVNAKERHEGLRVEIGEHPGSGARFQLAGGH